MPLIVTRPLATPLGLRPLGTLRPLEDILALLTRAGFSGPDALHIYRALFGFLHGHILDELQELTVSPDETDDLLRLGLHRLPISDFPLLRGLAPVLAAYDGAAELERGLDILLTGLTTTLTPSPAPTRPHASRLSRRVRIRRATMSDFYENQAGHDAARLRRRCTARGSGSACRCRPGSAARAARDLHSWASCAACATRTRSRSRVCDPARARP